MNKPSAKLIGKPQSVEEFLPWNMHEEKRKELSLLNQGKAFDTS